MNIAVLILLLSIRILTAVVDMASLDLSTNRKQKYQNGNIHRNLRILTSEREGNVKPARTPRARHAWKKITQIYGNPRAGPARALSRAFMLFSQEYSTRGENSAKIQLINLPARLRLHVGTMYSSTRSCPAARSFNHPRGASLPFLAITT